MTETKTPNEDSEAAGDRASEASGPPSSSVSSSARSTSPSDGSPPDGSARDGWASRPWAPWVVLAARFSLAAVLAFAAIPKLGDAAAFARDIDNYHMIPVDWAAPLAVMMPPLEILVALALLSGIHARGAALISAGMMLVFAVAMAQAIARGIDLDCGCFGSALAMHVSGWSILRNVVLASLSLPIVLGPEIPPRALPSLVGLGPRPTTPA